MAEPSAVAETGGLAALAHDPDLMGGRGGAGARSGGFAPLVSIRWPNAARLGSSPPECYPCSVGGPVRVMRSRLLGIFAAAVVGGAVLAQTSVDARPRPASGVTKLVRRAGKALRRRAYEPAARLYLSAYEVEADPDLLRRAARSFERAARHLAAARHYRLFLDATAARGAGREDAGKRLRRLDKRLARSVTWVAVRAEPAGSRVVFDDGGEWLEGPAPFGSYLEHGPHRLRVLSEGHQEETRQLLVERGPPIAVEVELSPRRRTGLLVVRSATPGATVVVDGEPVGTTPLPDPVELTQGQHRVEVIPADGEPWTTAVAVMAGETVAVEVALAPPPTLPAPDQAALLDRIPLSSWVAAAVSVAAVVAWAGFAAALTAKSGERDDYLAGRRSNQATRAGLESLEADAQSYALMGNLSLALAGTAALVAAGSALLLAKGEEE